MKSILAFIKKFPVLSYFILTFAVSWGGIILVMAWMGGIPTTREVFNAQFPFAIFLMIVGPCFAGLLMTGLIDGRQGFRDLFARLLKWRVGLRWYIIAILSAPLVLLGVLLSLSLISPMYIPGIFDVDNPSTRLLFVLTAALVTGIMEEIGWIGFAVPRLRGRYSILVTGLIVGILWGGWHIMGQVVMASGIYTGEISLHFFLVAQTIGLLIGILPAYRILMVWVYDRTGSLSIAIIMHTVLTGATMLFEPVRISGIPLFVYVWLSAALMWIIALAVTASDRRQPAKS